MITNLTAGSKVKFQYIDRVNNYDTFPAHTSYEVKEYNGTILEVRDTQENAVAPLTVYRKPAVERSRYLLTVQMPDNKIKSFYDGRVINLQPIPEAVKKNFLRRMVDKLKGS